MDIQKLFLSLTDYTYGYGEEDMLRDRLPKDLKKDECDNYYMEIGESETMFCSHLDTVSYSNEKVTHDIFKTKKGDIGIGTSGDTILGADDKAGVVILMYLIEHNVPGLYYFFVGEEVGAVGSKNILNKNPEKFKKYKRCIAFDRRDYGSIITKQKGRECCSNEFAEALSTEFSKYGMKYKADPTGIFTDSATFMATIPECTNLSVGYFNEHTVAEVINMTYLINLCNTVIKMDWESLPTVRDLSKVEPERTYSYDNMFLPQRKQGKNQHYDYDELKLLFYDIDELITGALNMDCINFGQFMPEREMIYEDEKTGKEISIFIHENGTFSVGKDKFDDIYDFKHALYVYYGYKPTYNSRYNEEEEEEEENYMMDTLYDIFDEVDLWMEQVFNMVYNSEILIGREMIFQSDKEKCGVTIYEDGTIKIGKHKFPNIEVLQDLAQTYFTKKKGSYKFGDDIFKNVAEYNKAFQQYEKEKGKIEIDNEKSSSSQRDTNIDKGAKDFVKGLDMNEFIFDIISYSYETGSKNISVRIMMIKFLDPRHKSIESLIMWLYSRNNDPDKTYGLWWDDQKNNFVIEYTDTSK